MSHNPGADELRMRAILRTRGVGPAALPPKPTTRPRDWLDDILDAEKTPAPPAAPAPMPEPATAPAVEETKPPPAAKPSKRRRRPKTNPARSAFDTQPPSPRQSLAEAWDRVPYRLKWLVQHALAAAAGWRLGWVDWSTDTAAWYAAGHWTAPSAWVLYGLGVLALAAYSRTRAWRWLAACAAAVPITSVVAGVLLYGTGYQP